MAHDTQFNCKRCGCCCRQAGRIMESLPLALAAVLAPTRDGACRHLAEPEPGKFHCTIYRDRPTICRTEELTPMRAAAWGITQADAAAISRNACKLLRKMENQP